MMSPSEASALVKNRWASLATMLIGVVTVSLALVGCQGHKRPLAVNPAALSEQNINLIFVTTPDLAYHAPGDIQLDTANLTSQGLNRSLMLATFLKEQVLGGKNVDNIYALAPMTHLQTANGYPDMTAIGYIQQFALLNQETLHLDKNANGATYTASTFPLNVAYPSPASLPTGVAAPRFGYSVNCSGLDFYNTGGSNDALIARVVDHKIAGFHVFSAPWETVRDLLASTNTTNRYDLPLPSDFLGPNQVYAITIPPTGRASLVAYDSGLTPPVTYPTLPFPLPTVACNNSLQANFQATRTGGLDGVTVPANSNTNQTVYIVRHAEAHPDLLFQFENGNYVATGQWRALALPSALAGKVSPQVVYSVDPSQWFTAPLSNEDNCYVRTSLTVLPYAIAKNLPYHLVTGFSLFDSNVANLTRQFFFTGGKFSNQKILLGWESQRILPLIQALLDSYGGTNLRPLPELWRGEDYNTIWTVTLDAQGNLTVDNGLCEGIDSAKLPNVAPPY